MVNFQEVFLVVIGGIIGSWLRYLIIEFNSQIASRKYIGTIIVNTISSFLLAIIFSFNDISIFTNSSFNLFFVIGFLGSLSTFSTFIIELMQSMIDRKPRDILLLSLSSAFIFFLVSIVFQIKLY